MQISCCWNSGLNFVASGVNFYMLVVVWENGFKRTVVKISSCNLQHQGESFHIYVSCQPVHYGQWRRQPEVDCEQLT